MLIKVLEGVVLDVFFNYDLCSIEDKFVMRSFFFNYLVLGVDVVVGVDLDFF